MAAKGFAGQAALNRRRSLMFVGLYCLTFVPIALLALAIVPVLLGNAMHSLFVDPLHYGPTYLPIAILLALAVLAHSFLGFRKEVADALKIKEVTASEEPRLARIGEEQAILQGLTNPAYGIIEVPSLNAVTIGATSNQRMIAVTRGLLDTLDDDEIAAVIAHELAHWRSGDVAFLTLNHALMHTAVLLQTYNPIKIEKNVHQRFQWHIAIAVFIPIILVVQAIGGAMTMYAARLARRADASIRAARDFVADAEALRFTHFPEALESAIRKCDGRGYFPGAERFESMLFAGNPVSQGGSHASFADRATAIGSVAGDMYMPGRQRRDTRTINAVPAQRAPVSARGAFGRRGLAPGSQPAIAMAAMPGMMGSFAEASRRSREIPREPGLWLLLTAITDRKSYREWKRGMFDQLKWRHDDGRNFIGATTEMTIWFVAGLAASIALYASLATSPTDFLERWTGRAFFAGSDQAVGSLYCAPGDTGCREQGIFRHESKPEDPGTFGT